MEYSNAYTRTYVPAISNDHELGMNDLDLAREENMYRLGDYISQGVGTVAGPLQSSGGAVDIIVVEQPDGSFRSTPWYVKFGKVLGVIRRTEKTVDIAVNGEEADFHLFLDRSGHAYFFNEKESIQEESSVEITNAAQSVLPIKASFQASNSANEIEGLSSETCSKISWKENGVRGYSHGMPPKKQTPGGDDKDDEQFQNAETQTNDSEVVLASTAGHVANTSVFLSEEHFRQVPEVSLFHDQVVFAKSDPSLSAQYLISSDYDNVQADNTVDDDALKENSDTQIKLSICESVYDVHGNCKEQNGDPADLNEKNGIERKGLFDTVSFLQEGGLHQSQESRTTKIEIAHLTDIANRPEFDSLHGITSKFLKIQIPSNCVLGSQESVVTTQISMERYHSLNAVSTEISAASLESGYEKENSNDCVQPGTDKSEDAIAADDIQATESERQPGRQKERTNTPTSEQLSSLKLKGGQNIITFTFLSSVFGKQQVEARIYLWKWNTRIVVSDVDGTITKSDVLGHVLPLVGKDWSHLGVARLFSAIKDNGYQLLFLSARAISQAHVTRQFLLNLKQEGKALPDGPIVISPDGLFPSLYREVIRKTPHEFKIQCLQDIRTLFPSDGNPFHAGFGNRVTDEISYLKVGIPKGKIFTINFKGEVVVNRLLDLKSYSSLHKFVDGMFPSMHSSQH
ncbi:hypothetical protein KI387_010588, partial [Taxus chinensis]